MSPRFSARVPLLRPRVTPDPGSRGSLMLRTKVQNCKRIWRALMPRRVDYRDGLDATAAPGAGPAGSVEQEAADLPLHAGSHLTPLTAPHYSSWGRARKKKRAKDESDRLTKPKKDLQMSTIPGTN